MRCPSPRYVWPKGKVIGVPCGKCLICLQNKRHDWAFRLMEEYKVSTSAHFVTLTYSEKFNPKNLCKRHLQLYLKRLRKRSPKLRYYAVGEYGETTLRPHYHAIIFNASEDTIRKSWVLHDSKGREFEIGIVHIGKVTEASVQYVLKYIVQKDDIPQELAPPFSIMSRGYGLGAHYLSDAMLHWHRSGDRVFVVKYGEKLRLPRYYKDKIWPASDWSDWQNRRDSVFTKAQKEAEKREKEDNRKLKQVYGIKDPEIYKVEAAQLQMRRIKSKVKYTQHL